MEHFIDSLFDKTTIDMFILICLFYLANHAADERHKELMEVLRKLKP